MCLKCFEPVQIGWQQKHHIRQCTGRPDATNFILAKETLEPTGEDQPNNELFAVNAAGDNLLAAIDEGTHQRATLGADEVEREPAKKKLRVFFFPKTNEILEFLGTAEMGEGCSREHAQGWLNYHKKKRWSKCAIVAQGSSNVLEARCGGKFSFGLAIVCLAVFPLPFSLPFTLALCLCPLAVPLAFAFFTLKLNLNLNLTP